MRTHDQTTHVNNRRARQVALIALLSGLGIMGLKLIVFYLTGSAAVLTDALESIINIVAAGIMWYALWLSGQPADREHPYGHGKIEFMTLGLEGGMILAAGLMIGFVAIRRMIHPVELQSLDLGMLLLMLVNLLSTLLAGFVYLSGRKLQSPVLIADAKHLLTDVASTLGVVVGLVLVRVTGLQIIDPILALVLAVVIMFTSWRLLRASADGLMDRIDPQDQVAIEEVLDDEIQQGCIRGYHKVRHRHTGAFHWVDMHLQVDGDMSVHDSHALASRIEYRIEQKLGQAKATAHIEPEEIASSDQPSEPERR